MGSTARTTAPKHTAQIMALELPEPVGPIVRLTEKLYIPVQKYPDYNFIGRIIGHRGSNLKTLEQATQCTIKIRDDRSEEQPRQTRRSRRTPSNSEIGAHVLVVADDTRNRAAVKLAAAVAKLQKLLIPGDKPIDLQSWITPKSRVSCAEQLQSTAPVKGKHLYTPHTLEDSHTRQIEARYGKESLKPYVPFEGFPKRNDRQIYTWPRPSKSLHVTGYPSRNS